MLLNMEPPLAHSAAFKLSKSALLSADPFYSLLGKWAEKPESRILIIPRNERFADQEGKDTLDPLSLPATSCL